MAKQITIHLLWVIAALVAVLIAFVVVTPSGDLLKEYISFASAISSILLALVAIFYAFISSGSVNSSLSEIKSAAQLLSAQADRLNLASSGLGDEAEDILRKLSALPDHVVEFRGEISRKIDDLATTKITKDGAVDAGLTAKSVGHLVALYLISTAYKSKRSFNIDDVFDDDSNYGARLYCHGIIEAFKSYKINGIVIEGLEGKYMINGPGNFKFDEIIQDTNDNFDRESHRALASSLEAVDKYFETRKSIIRDVQKESSPEGQG